MIPQYDKNFRKLCTAVRCSLSIDDLLGKVEQNIDDNNRSTKAAGNKTRIVCVHNTYKRNQKTTLETTYTYEYMVHTRAYVCVFTYVQADVEFDIRISLYVLCL